MKNKQSLITFILFALFLGASYFAKKSQLIEEEQTPKKLLVKRTFSKEAKPARIPASSSLELAELAAQMKPQQETIPSGTRDVEALLKFKKNRLSRLNRKIAQISEPKQKLTVSHSQLELLLDYVPCLTNCPEGDLVSSINNLKIIDPHDESKSDMSSSLGYAFREKSNPRVVGFWNKQLIISTNGTNPKFKKELENLNFAEIDSPLKNSYVVKYDQDVNSLDKIIDQIKKIDSVMSVSLDLITQPVRFKNAN